jgi:asparagine synthase (glutamine-hydrolysing)
MCGIAGIIRSDGAEVDMPDLETLSLSLVHRGPDGHGLWTSADKNVGFVHRRLAILDTTLAGSQPMLSTDSRYSIVFNGEIYNFLELRAELEARGSRFRTDTDTEVILEAWRHWGAGMLGRMNGMWALAIHDLETRETFFARDRFGVKPLYYVHTGTRFAFASEIRALRRLPWLDKAIDQPTVQRMLFDPFSVEGGERTLLKSIRRLPAGHFATLRERRFHVERWWRTLDNLVESPSSAGARAERFKELFYASVGLRMRSDVPIGTCLSGGFDSSAITCAMSEIAGNGFDHKREAKDWRHVFIASFPGKENDETRQALEVATYAGVNPHLITIRDEDALTHIETILDDFDDVYIGLPTSAWQLYLELRNNGIVVSIDGHGADELMGGYRQQGQSLSFFLRNLVAATEGRAPSLRIAVEAGKAAWLSASGLNYIRGARRVAPVWLGSPFDDDPMPEDWGVFNKRLYQMFHVTTLPTILRNFDRMSMAHGVEVRMPFMDWRLVTYVMSLAQEAKVSAGRTKAVARDALAGVMPESIRMSRRKVGFSSPMPEWMNGPLGKWAHEILGQQNPAFDEIVDTPSLRRRIDDLNTRKAWDWRTTGRLWPYVHMRWYLAMLNPQTQANGSLH